MKGFNMKRINRVIDISMAVLLAAAVIVFSACSVLPASIAVQAAGTGEESETSASSEESGTGADQVSVEFSPEDMDDAADASDLTYIRLMDDSADIEGSGASAEGSTVTITASGAYDISGTLGDGRIMVYSEEIDPVRLILNGADISCSYSAPIYIINDSETIITLVEGTDNYITDGDAYQLDDTGKNEPSAAIFSNDDVTINGKGSLTVDANYKNGIETDDDLKIVSGNITVTAVNDGIKGKDSLSVKEANITVEAGDDGMQSENDEDEGKGFIYIQDGIFDITAGADAIEAWTSVLIEGGTFDIVTGGGSASNSTGSSERSTQRWQEAEDTPSAKGIKAEGSLVIEGGSIVIDSCDDSIHSNDTATVNGGDIALSSGDDGIHADSSLVINGGIIEIEECYEGIESAVICVNGGDIGIKSSDDAVNVSSGDGGSFAEARPGQNESMLSSDGYLEINGGYMVLDSGGDALDVNGGITMTGGTVIINGPTENFDGAIDYYSYFNMEGGFLIAAGSSGMAQAPGGTSAQYSVMVNLDSVQQGGTLFHIETADGEAILTFMPAKEYQSIVFCSPVLENGMECVIYTGGSTTGISTDGLYAEGDYEGGSRAGEFTVSGIVTVYGNAAGMMQQGGPGGEDEMRGPREVPQWQ